MPSRRYIDLPDIPSEDNDWKALHRAIADHLVQNVQRVQRHTKHPDGRSHESIYIGTTGTALMEYRLLSLSVPVEDDSLAAETLSAAADHNLASVLSIRPMSHKVLDTAHASFLETDVGIATLVLRRSSSTSDKSIKEHWQACKQLLETTVEKIDYEDKDSSDIDEDGCEVLYGRAGLLYALLALKATQNPSGSTNELSSTDGLGALISDATIEKIMNSIILRGKYGASVYEKEVIGTSHGSKALPQLMWAWHGKRYLGGAHGIAGILQILLACPNHLVSKYVADILSTVDWLLDCQDKEGNWPTKAPGKYDPPIPEPSGLVQWCHGATGILILLSTVLRKSQTEGTIPLKKHACDKIVVSLRRGAAVIYRYGLLKKGVGLCHGVAGSVYALLAVSDALDISPEKTYFTQAVHLAYSATYHEAYTAKGKMKVPDHRWSLYEGMAGMCCAWGEVLCRMKSGEPAACSGMPGYDDLN